MDCQRDNFLLRPLYVLVANLLDLRALYFVSPVSSQFPQFSLDNSNQFNFDSEKGRRYPTTPPLVGSRNPAAGDPQRNAGSNNPESNGHSYA